VLGKTVRPWRGKKHGGGRFTYNRENDSPRALLFTPLASAAVLQPGTSRSLRRACQLSQRSGTRGRDALGQTALPCSSQRSARSHVLPAPLGARVSGTGGTATRRRAGTWQGHHAAERHPKPCASYRSQQALGLLDSAVASQEPHEHHDSSDRNQDVDSCKRQREANALLWGFVRQHPSAWPDTPAPRAAN